MAWQQANKDMAFLTPSSWQPSQAPPVSRVRRQRSKIGSQYVGTLVHQLLEKWDFQLDPENFREPLRALCQKTLLGDLDDAEKKEAVWDIEELMETFLRSSSYREMQQATVIGREVPFVMPWPNNEPVGVEAQLRVMEGVIDVVYDVAGEVWVGDYKTDRVTTSNVVRYADMYRHQAQVYAIAASQSLGLNIKGCKFFFLRIGEVVPIMCHMANKS
jgi:ATP-dependent helicase/nuclease subunit A